MLISCPACSTTFSVPAKAIGPEGKKVKCSKCANIWHQAPAEYDRASLDNLLKTDLNNAPKESEDNQLPAKNNIYIPLYLPACIIACLAVVAIFIGMAFPSENLNFVHNLLGIKNYSALKLVDFTSDSEVIDNKLDFAVKGSLVNISNKPVEVPEITVEVLSGGGFVMSKSQYIPAQKILPPYGRIEITPELKKISGNAKNIQLTFGNWAELKF